MLGNERWDSVFCTATISAPSASSSISESSSLGEEGGFRFSISVSVVSPKEFELILWGKENCDRTLPEASVVSVGGRDGL